MSVIYEQPGQNITTASGGTTTVFMGAGAETVTDEGYDTVYASGPMDNVYAWNDPDSVTIYSGGANTSGQYMLGYNDKVFMQPSGMAFIMSVGNGDAVWGAANATATVNLYGSGNSVTMATSGSMSVTERAGFGGNEYQVPIGSEHLSISGLQTYGAGSPATDLVLLTQWHLSFAALEADTTYSGGNATIALAHTTISLAGIGSQSALMAHQTNFAF
jgi:hypothetical protein